LKGFQNKRLVLFEDHQVHLGQLPPDRFLPEEDTNDEILPEQHPGEGDAEPGRGEMGSYAGTMAFSSKGAAT